MATEVNDRGAFDEALQNSKQAIMLVLGNEASFSDIASAADEAVLFPATQAVVWVRDVGILTVSEKRQFRFGDPEFVACALSLPPRRPCAFIARPLALTLSFQQAFTAAEANTQPAMEIK